MPGSDDVAERVARGFAFAERLRRANVSGAECLEVDGLLLALSNLPEPALNGVMVEREPRHPASAFAEAERLMAARGLAFGVDVQAGRHPAVDRWLTDAGLTRLLVREAMTSPVGTLPEALPPPGVEIRRVADEDEAAALARVDVASFGGSKEIALRFYAAGAFGVEGAASFVAWEGAEPAGAATGYRHEGSVGVFGVGVVPSARGRGLGRALTVTAARAFPGVDLAWLHPTPEAGRLYDRLGFVRVADWEVWVRR
jgi:ribosomal protein S18 acetylase RimI-like enzyme